MNEERRDDSGQLRLIAPTVTAGQILRLSVGHIAIYANSDEYVMASLHRVLDNVSPELKLESDVHAVAELRLKLSKNTGN